MDELDALPDSADLEHRFDGTLPSLLTQLYLCWVWHGVPIEEQRRFVLTLRTPENSPSGG